MASSVSCCYVACVGYRHPVVRWDYMGLENNTKKYWKKSEISNKHATLTSTY